MPRPDGRQPDALRPVEIARHFIPHAEGSVLITLGSTRVVCTASIEERVPPWLRGTGQGWITAEYGMLPRSTHERTPRERNHTGGRTHEIQRLIGRALRSTVDLQRLGDRTITVDCDVLQADGGTRTAAITGAMVALVDALAALRKTGALPWWPLRELIAATSVGIVDREMLLDLSYIEDSRASVDLNLVLTESGKIVELQGTAEGAPYSRQDLTALMALGERGIKQLIEVQRQALADVLTALPR